MRIRQEIQALPRPGCLTNGLNLEASTARSEALASVIKTFQSRGIENPRREARLSLCAASGISPVALIIDPREPLGPAASRVQEVAARRASRRTACRGSSANGNFGASRSRFRGTCWIHGPKRKPSSKLRSQYSGIAAMNSSESSTLASDLAHSCAPCLSSSANARGIGVDISADAVDVALGNLEACGLSDRGEIRVGDWTDGLEGQFDLIVSNPPYIPSADLARLPRGVRDFDPWLALDGGIDGLAAYRRILTESSRILAPHGCLLAELGVGQAADVTAIAGQCGFTDVVTYQDLRGLDRVLAIRP